MFIKKLLGFFNKEKKEKRLMKESVDDLMLEPEHELMEEPPDDLMVIKKEKVKNKNSP